MNALKKRAIILLVVFLFFCSSCAQPPPPPELIKPAVQSVGETLFLSEDYTNALKEYSHDYETSHSPDDRNNALFGLACTQLIMAESDSQLSDAITAFEKWHGEKGDKQSIENPRLLVIALKALSERIQKNNKKQARLAKRKNTVIANQKKKITNLGNTVDNIQKQLDELEAIDETLQEKKKSL